MKICLLGGTGRTGSHVLTEALKSGHEIKALVRNPLKVTETSNQLTLVEGTPLDKDDLRQAMEGCEVLITTLNIARKSDFPWSKLVSPPDLLSRTMENIIDLAKETGVKQVVTLSAYGTNETKAHMPLLFRWVVNSSKIGVTYRDHEKQEDMLRASKLDWTIVRPVGLTNATEDQRVMIMQPGGPKPSMTISRLAVARFMLDAVENRQYVGQAVGICEQKNA